MPRYPNPAQRHNLTALVIMLVTFLYFPDIDAKQELYFKRFGRKHGLSESVTNCIYQCSRGYIWFGNREGLYRFDGYDFVAYKYNPEDSTSLSSSEVIYINEDSKGRLWIGTLYGLDLFDRKTETFQHFYLDTTQNGTCYLSKVLKLELRILRFFQDKSDNIWVCYENRPTVLIDTDAMTVTPISSIAQDNNIIFQGSDGMLWFGFL
jgi:ligand-binding sensor domain-containing protein